MNNSVQNQSQKPPNHQFCKRKNDGGDGEAWEILSTSIQEVQSILDRNRILIQQVNENHQSKIHQNLVKNVEIIREINENISRVRSIYSDLSADLLQIFHQLLAENRKNDLKFENSQSKNGFPHLKF